MTLPDLIWPAQLALSSIMTGIIWQVQLLTYPQFLNVSEGDFPEYHRSHTMRMGWIVVPVMVAELGLAVVAVWLAANAIPISGLALVAAAWACTGLVQVPLHNRLSKGYDRKSIQALVSTNWIRTGIWTVRTGLLLWWIAR